MRIRNKTDLFAWLFVLAMIGGVWILASSAWSVATKLFRLIAG